MAGKKKYVPPKVLEELKHIKRQCDIKGKRTDAQAFKKMAEYSTVGREVDTMRKKIVLYDIWGKKKKSK